MNKVKLCLLTTVFLISGLNAQKPLIDSTTYDKFPTFNGASISNNGRYLYFITHDPQAEKDTLSIRSTETKWKVDLLGVSSPQFTQDSRKILFKSNDSLCSIDLGNSSIHYVQGPISNYALLEKGQADNLLVCRLKNNPDQLSIKVMRTGEQRLFSSIENYWFDANRGVLLFQTHEKAGENMVYHLKQFDFNNNVSENLAECDKIDKLVFCKDGSQFAYITRNVIGERAIWYCESGKQKPVKLIEDQSTTMAPGLKIDDVLGLTGETRQLYFTLIKTDTEKKVTDPVGVDVWSYKDPKLQSQQLVELGSNSLPKRYKALFKIADHQLILLETENEELRNFSLSSLPKKWVLVRQTGTGDFVHEWNWNKNARSSLYLLSLRDGSRRLVNKNIMNVGNCVLSPDENFLLFYDPLKSNYISYEIAQGVYRNLTATIRTQWTMLEGDDDPVAKFRACQIAGFVKGYDYALLYDRYDIYRMDLTGKKLPVNLTRGFGRSHHLVLRLALTDHNIFDPSEKLILHAFNTDTKSEGYYSISLNEQVTPVCMTMQPAKVDALIKARDADSYLVFRTNANESPNVLFTHDLTSFSPISHLHPEKGYNWLTTELITWKSFDGTSCQGILYKPQNFDPRRKYPLLIHYYERLSDQLHEFLYPEASGGQINIPFFVSNGFLVFTPDIHYKIGKPGRSAFNCVVSAANLLSKRRYIDAKKIGLQGISFGGFETNYIITHTNIFAAAMSASGMSDFVSIYNSIIGDGTSRQRQYEVDRDRMGATLWQIPGLYIENSPVLRANAVTTPLLMMANEHDGDVPYQQGVEFFTALRRLGRKAWMLQYDRQGHSLSDIKAKNDFTIRVFQFFNYYLKGDYPPLWMTDGVPAKRKGMFTGLELDKSGKTP